ncbi:hypothetical protein HELRODRAFT_178123 [Helobdella robusta]|uniref:Uncharacterized protein n=1 Tax=Helobdella robusta TaxID=6412 RepID=T1FCS3_HELRO|nr:hypothetical protein HELRODRAFT_178123 [Helobdella robusta]ESN97336.1 hypothetical protein HELRODRAFT_178123 [Helobdella robusta]
MATRYVEDNDIYAQYRFEAKDTTVKNLGNEKNWKNSLKKEEELFNENVVTSGRNNNEKNKETQNKKKLSKSEQGDKNGIQNSSLPPCHRRSKNLWNRETQTPFRMLGLYSYEQEDDLLQQNEDESFLESNKNYSNQENKLLKGLEHNQTSCDVETDDVKSSKKNNLILENDNSESCSINLATDGNKPHTEQKAQDESDIKLVTNVIDDDHDGYDHDDYDHDDYDHDDYDHDDYDQDDNEEISVQNAQESDIKFVANMINDDESDIKFVANMINYDHDDDAQYESDIKLVANTINDAESDMKLAANIIEDDDESDKTGSQLQNAQDENDMKLVANMINDDESDIKLEANIIDDNDESDIKLVANMIDDDNDHDDDDEKEQKEQTSF